MDYGEYDDSLIDSSVLLEKSLSSDDLKKATRFVKRKVVFVILPDPFDKGVMSPMDRLRYGFKVANHSGLHHECPILCYSFKLGLYGFNQWSLRTGAFSEQMLFDMQVSQMLRSNYVVVYSNGDYTESMNRLLNIARLHIARIDIRSI